MGNRIGIYKVGNPICWDSGKVNDLNGFCYETTKLCDLFDKFGNEVYLVSRCTGETPAYLNTETLPEMLDAIYVVAGNHDFDEYGEEIYLRLRDICDKMYLIQTDSLMKISTKSVKLFDCIFTQQKRKVYDFKNIPECYSGMPELTLFNEKIIDKEKNHLVVFGGSERQREEKIIEYVIRPQVTSYLKMPSMNIQSRIPYPKFQDVFSRAKYTIVIPSKNDTHEGHTTPKVYDAIRMGVFPLIDSGFDPNDLLNIGDVKDLLIVKNYKEMRAKIIELEDNKSRKCLIMGMLKGLLKKEYFDGTFTYECLTRKGS